jgi:hypothetical protein
LAQAEKAKRGDLRRAKWENVLQSDVLLEQKQTETFVPSVAQNLRIMYNYD